MSKFYPLFLFFFSIIHCFGQTPKCTTNDPTLCYIDKKYQTYPFGIEKKWESSEIISRGNLLTIYDVDFDCIPEIITVGKNADSLFIFDSRSFLIKYKFKTIVQGINLLSIADVDNDGKVDFFMTSNYLTNQILYDGRIVCYQLDGTIKWISNQVYDIENSQISQHSSGLADFNQDGQVELYINNKIFNAATGVKLADGGLNGKGIAGSLLANVAVGNLDENSNDLELAAGYTIYEVVINNANGLLGNSMTSNNLRINNGRYDGNTAIADINNDSILDVIVLSLDRDKDGFMYAYFQENGIVKLISQINLPVKINFAYSRPIVFYDNSDKTKHIVFGTEDRYFNYGLNLLNQFELSGK
jgi:hypothetical protein